MRYIAYALIGLCSVATAQAGTMVVTIEGGAIRQRRPQRRPV
jgi:hypothetical protein